MKKPREIPAIKLDTRIPNNHYQFQDISFYDKSNSPYNKHIVPHYLLSTVDDAAVQLFHRPVSLVINSHFHLDHVGGNQSFPDAQIISTKQTRCLMLERTQQFLTFALNHPEYPASVQAMLDQETDERKRHELAVQLGDILAMDTALA
ncbi:MBL fold metallo-hydrolase [Brevibacillus nitrificans]|uniref:MBL fold metallo-hydrolase n=1 Tax=Brevibacillus nitrificans TaxID=651560 RepID=UPI00286AD97F|nr:MBL fold metallo-hydrolase [Brevibacillus nitrificans]